MGNSVGFTVMAAGAWFLGVMVASAANANPPRSATPPPVITRTPTVVLDAAKKPPGPRGAATPSPDRAPVDTVDTSLVQSADGRVLLRAPSPRPGRESLLINLSGEVEADGITIVDGEAVLSGLDMGVWTEMLTSVSSDYADWDMGMATAEDDTTSVEVVTSRISSIPPAPASLPVAVARIANRDFADGVNAAWQKFGTATLASAKRLVIGNKSYRSPIGNGGTFLIARPAASKSPGGVEQQVSVNDGEQINFHVLFASPELALGDEISVDLVREGIEMPLFMASGIQSQEPRWQSVSYTVPPGGTGTYLLRLTIVTKAASAGQRPFAGFLVDSKVQAVETDPSGLRGLE